MTTQKLKTSIMARRRAAANLLGLAVGIGLTIALGGLVYSMATGVFDSAATISTVEIQNARAYNTGDQAYVSFSVKNTGTDAAEQLTAVVLLECNGEDGAKSLLLNQADKDMTTDCNANQHTSNPAPVKPGLLESRPIGTITNLEPSETASLSGGVLLINNATALADGDPIQFASGHEYLIEVSGLTTSGETIIQTATIKPR